jgi:hypothetical protein
MKGNNMETKTLVVNPENTTLTNCTALMDNDAWTLKGHELAEYAKRKANKWSQANVDLEVSTAELVDVLIVLRQESKAKKSLGQLLAAALDTPENRRTAGVKEITTEHLTGSKGLQLPNKGNARATYNLVNALELAHARGAQLDKTTAHVLLREDGDSWSRAYIGLAAFLRKNESVSINKATITEVITFLCGTKTLAAWLGEDDRHTALLPAPPKPKGDVGDAPVGDAPVGDVGDAPVGDAPVGDAPEGNAPTQERAPHTAAGTTLVDMEEGIHAALTAALKSPTIQALADIAAALMKADNRLNGQKVDAASFIRATLAELPQERARNMQGAEDLAKAARPTPKAHK